MRSILPDWQIELARWLKPFLEQLGRVVFAGCGSTDRTKYHRRSELSGGRPARPLYPRHALLIGDP
jgi:hypothetical protein